jgi:L-ornithine N5-oxygenase
VAMIDQHVDTEPVDVIGIGFGPANLALAIALDEESLLRGGSGTQNEKVRFFERQPCFGWHTGMLLDGTRMQISFLKDLATMRNPTSEYSFLAYLQERGRLVDFINCKTFFPSRLEFHDYLSWAAARFRDVVGYGAEVHSIEPVLDASAVRALDVIVRREGSQMSRHRTRNVVIAAGLQPQLPPEVELSERVWHSSQLMHRLADIDPASIRTVLVIGSGQSGAEVTSHLHGVCPGAQVHSVFSRFGYSLADDSPFVNRIFDPESVDVYYGADATTRTMLWRYHEGTNYSVVDLDLIQDLFARSYEEKVEGQRRLHFHNVSRVTGCTETEAGVEVTVRNLASGRETALTCDIVVFATGYRAIDPERFLGPLKEYCRRDDEGNLEIGRDYRVRTSPDMHCGVYVQGAVERTHGISSVLLSNAAVRAQEIIRSLREHADHLDSVPAAAPL